MNRDSLHFLFLNIGHFLDHLFMLIFATAAALALSREWGLTYGELLGYATPGFFAFGLCAYPAGWIADKWSRHGMMCVFFIGIGLASVATGFARTPLQIGIGLFVIGVLAAIYHPVGLAMVTQRWRNTGLRIAVNGVWGNLGVACAALLTGYLIDNSGWRAAFIAPGIVSIVVGLAYAALCNSDPVEKPATAVTAPMSAQAPDYKAMLLRVSGIVFLTTAVSSVIFQATTFALPKIFDERLQGIVGRSVSLLESLGLPGRVDLATMVGWFAFVVFVVASMAQLVVGMLLDRIGPRRVFMGAAAIQVAFFALMAGLKDGWALAVALGFMLGAFGQIPINDYMVGRLATGPARARVYGVRYVVSFTALAAALPLIAFIYEQWGFDTLFRVLAGASLVILIAVAFLPRKMPAVPA
ncbi:MAG: MFS transporter [Hyphomicrobiales bacterium]|nr:MFS transporter [Alphaproteobacteria bacterium]